MSKIICSALGAITVAAMGLSGCGSDSSSEIVAKVGGSSISKAMLEHWIPIEAVLTYELYPKKPVPRGVAPDPPNYAACIGYLASTPQTAVASSSKPTTTELKSKCQQRYRALREHMLDFLISAAWVDAESIDQGVQVTRGEVMQELARIKHEVFPAKGQFQRFLAVTGLSLSDELLRVKKDMLDARLEQKIGDKKGLSGTRRQQLLAEYYVQFQRKWAARTSCRAGYIILDCKQYQGTASEAKYG